MVTWTKTLLFVVCANRVWVLLGDALGVLGWWQNIYQVSARSFNFLISSSHRLWPYVEEQKRRLATFLKKDRPTRTPQLISSPNFNSNKDYRHLKWKWPTFEGFFTVAEPLALRWQSSMSLQSLCCYISRQLCSPLSNQIFSKQHRSALCLTNMDTLCNANSYRTFYSKPRR